MSCRKRWGSGGPAEVY